MNRQKGGNNQDLRTYYPPKKPSETDISFQKDTNSNQVIIDSCDPDQVTEIFFVNVGKGSCTIVKTYEEPNNYDCWIFDCGSNHHPQYIQSTNEQDGASIMGEYIANLIGNCTFLGVIFSHPDTDHYNVIFWALHHHQQKFKGSPYKTFQHPILYVADPCSPKDYSSSEKNLELNTNNNLYEPKPQEKMEEEKKGEDQQQQEQQKKLEIQRQNWNNKLFDNSPQASINPIKIKAKPQKKPSPSPVLAWKRIERGKRLDWKGNVTDNGEIYILPINVKNTEIKNDKSVCILLTLKNKDENKYRKILLTGDINADDLSDFAQQSKKNQDSIKDLFAIAAPHHGAEGSCEKKFLMTVNPELIFISSHRDQKNHPSVDSIDNALNFLSKRNNFANIESTKLQPWPGFGKTTEFT